jgi:hypothetical protein
MNRTPGLPRTAPSGVFYGWVIVAVTILAILAVSGVRAAPGALLVDMERSTVQWGFGLSVGLAGFL